MKKTLISLLIIFLTGFVLLFFLASGANLDESAYYVVKKHPAKPISDVPDTLRVMTYNIGYLSGMTNNLPVKRHYTLFETNLDKAVRLLDQLHPHVVGLQEVDFGSSRSYDQNQLDSLAIRSDFRFSFRSINWDKRYVPFPYWPIKAHFGQIISGQAILSQFRISIDTTIALMKPVNSSFVYDTFYLDRLIQACNIQVGAVTVKVINVHLEAFDAETREKQAHDVKVFYERYADHMPVLLIGDFNSEPSSEEGAAKGMEIIMQSANIASAITDDAYSSTPEEYFTFSSGTPYQMIDYILYNKNFIEKVESRVVQEAGEISDHLPVFMKFVFKE